jgi:hypothetical protein
MDAGFCVDCLEEAIKNYGSLTSFNTDLWTGGGVRWTNYLLNGCGE